MILKIGVSGKRQVEDCERRRVYEEIYYSIKELLIKHRTIDFIGYTALAEGADMIFAEVVTKEYFKPLQIVLPFDEVEYESDFTDSSKIILRNYIREHKVAKVVTEGKPADEARDEAYYAAGKALVDECDEMIFVWDGLKPEGKGGTADIIAYQALKAQDVLQNNASTLILLSNSDLLGKLQQEFKCSDMEAIRNATNYRRSWRWSIFFGFIVATCFAIKTGFYTESDKNAQFWFTFLEVFFAFAGFFTHYWASRKEWHENYLEERQRSEVLRILICYYSVGIPVKIRSLLDEGGSGRAAHTAKLIVSVNEAAELNAQSDKYVSRYFNEFVVRGLIDEQVNYHKRKIERMGAKHPQLEKANKVIGILFLINLLVHFSLIVGTRFEWEPLFAESIHHWAIFFTILFPALFASVEGVIYFNEWAVMTGHLKLTQQNLIEAKAQLLIGLDEISDDGAKDRLANTLNLTTSIMLNDNKNWMLIFESKEVGQRL